MHVKHPLAVLTERFGLATQTFIRRHIIDLLPGRTVVVARTVDPTYDGSLEQIPVLVLDRKRPGLIHRGANRAAARFSRQLPDHSERIAKRFSSGARSPGDHGRTPGLLPPMAAPGAELGIRFFPHGHGHDVSGRLRSARMRAEYLRYNNADGVITISGLSKQRLTAIGLQPDRIHVVPYGADVPPAPVEHAPGPAVRCLMVGRMVGKKAPILALDAFRRAADVCPELHLDVVGVGPLLPAVFEFVSAFRLESRVTLHGAVPHQQVMRMMHAADVFLQHSVVEPSDGDEEGLPVSILEAMASTLPVLSTYHAGIPEAVTDGVTGYLVEEGDTEGMAKGLIELARDPDRRLEMGRAGWLRAAEHFSWEVERFRLLKVLGLDAYIQ